ncbi:zinc-finger protein [Cryptotrichosporon argae]
MPAAPSTAGPPVLAQGTQHVCHWSNCHLAFGSMPDLLAHVAADHLGALPAAPAPALAPIVPAHARVAALPLTDIAMGDAAAASFEPTPAAVSPPFAPDATQPPIWLAALAPVQGGTDISFLDAILAPSAQQPGHSAETDALVSCLWDDCLPLFSPAGADPAALHAYTSSSLLTPPQDVAAAHAAHMHGQAPHSQAHTHTHAHQATGEALSPQTMLRHVLEEHLGVPGDVLGWRSAHDLGQAISSVSDGVAAGMASAAAPGIPGQATANIDHFDAHMHGHGHAHVHVHPHTHAHPHEHSHILMHGQGYDHVSHDIRAAYAHDLTMPHSNLRADGHAHAHTHAHAHAHAHVHRHRHPRRLHPLPTPPSSSSPPSPASLVCLWPSCTHPPFPSTAELMAHLSDVHVGRGRDSYVCRWGGCAEIECEGVSTAPDGVDFADAAAQNQGQVQAPAPAQEGHGGRVFRSRQKVLRHLGSHIGHKPHVCAMCGQAFSEAAPLAAHMRRHAHDKPFACAHPGCGKRFAISSSLTIHMRTHNGEKPFICAHCGKGFVEASNLTKHVRTHTGERPFACAHPGCEKRFPRPDQLKRHMAVHDGKVRLRKGSLAEG